mgnify:CR=1 FL=1
MPKGLIPQIKPKVVNYFYDSEGNAVGKAVGIILKDYDESDLVQEFILALEKLKNDRLQFLLIEDLHIFNKGQLELIEKSTNLKVVNGMNILVDFLPIVLDSIYRLLDKDLKSKEVLVIGNNEEVTKKVIESICKVVRFVTITGNFQKESVENIYQYILEKTGLSVFYSKNIDRILTNYSIIINLIDNCRLNNKKIRNGAIIFDFSFDKYLSRELRNNSRLTAIEDFMFKGDDVNFNNNGIIPELIPSHIYQYLIKRKLDDYYGVYANGHIYSTEDLVNLQIRNKGKV